MPVHALASRSIRIAHRLRILVVLVVCITFAACNARDSQSDASGADPEDRFWASLTRLCGRAYEGQVVEAVPADTSFAGKKLVIDVRSCDEREISIPFHVGENRSRTWVLTRTDSGMRLKHDHRHEDGVEDSVTQYGGDTRDGGSAERQEFYADTFTAELIPAAATNVWTIEILGDTTLVYALRREGTERRFRAEFDLRRSVPPPPAPWGHP